VQWTSSGLDAHQVGRMLSLPYGQKSNNDIPCDLSAQNRRGRVCRYDIEQLDELCMDQKARASVSGLLASRCHPYIVGQPYSAWPAATSAKNHNLPSAGMTSDSRRPGQIAQPMPRTHPPPDILDGVQTSGALPRQQTTSISAQSSGVPWTSKQKASAVTFVSSAQQKTVS